MPDKPVVVYGASGFSGRLIVEFLREYGVPFVAAGRDRARIEDVLDHVPGISAADYEIAEVEHSVAALTELFAGAKVVCNTVGPCISYGATQTIFGQLQWESFFLQENEYVEWPPVTTIEALIPGEFRTRLALPWGGFPHPVWFKDDPRIANVYAFGGLLDRSLMENVVAGQRDYQEKIR